MSDHTPQPSPVADPLTEKAAADAAEAADRQNPIGAPADAVSAPDPAVSAPDPAGSAAEPAEPAQGDGAPDSH